MGRRHRCSASPLTAVHPGAQKIQDPLHTVSTATPGARKEAAAADGKAPGGEGLPRRGAALWEMSRARRTPAAPACSVGASTLTSRSQEQEPEALHELSQLTPQKGPRCSCPRAPDRRGAWPRMAKLLTEGHS